MKRIALVCLALLIVCSFAGCSDSGDNSTVSENQLMIPANTEDGLTELFNRVSMIPAGTMGVSIQASQLALEILEWCDASAMTADEITARATAYTQEMDTATLDMYAMQAETVGGFLSQLQDADSRAQILTDLGLEKETFEWSQATFEKAKAVLTYPTAG